MVALSSPPLPFMGAVKVGLWSLWLPGLLLISVSIYFTQRLPSHVVDLETRRGFDDGGGGSGRVRITIYTAPRPFVGTVGDRQAVAVRSWLGLGDDVRVVLFGRDASVREFADGVGSRVSVESDIDFSFMGAPFFHSMVARSQTNPLDITVIIDPVAILLPDFISTLNFGHQLEHDWFLYAFTRGVPNFPFHLSSDGKQWLGEDGDRIQLQKLQEFLPMGLPSNCSEKRMLMAWRNSNVPLHVGVLPPFLYGRGIHDRWLINEVLHSKLRFVFDASWTISNFYLINSDDHRSHSSADGSLVLAMPENNWEYDGNLLLGNLYGQLYFHEMNYSDVMKLAKCDGHFVFVRSVESCSSPVHDTVPGLSTKKKILNCLSKISSSAISMSFIRRSDFRLSKSPLLPFDLEYILPVVADETKTIVLSIAGYSYKDMLMSWVCRLRSLRISNFLVWALDDDTYEFSVLQGLPVLRDRQAPRNISFNGCHFGTKCFQKVTKRKSTLVLRILKLGYNVLLSDVDVYWFKNPIPFLQSLGPAVLAAQSDEFNLTGPINLPRRSNSGFYFAQSDDPTIAALEKVVKHAENSQLSEQPSFYDTLCGEHGKYRVGDDKCWDPVTNLTVLFLDRDIFPNGAYKGLWEKRNVRSACKKTGSYILHNNWISGRQKKLSRQVSSGLWDYDIGSRMCLHKWYKRKVIGYI
ncbi:Beta-arabinofuranosyltransferase RAY1-like protein [Drosera capensis]